MFGFFERLVEPFPPETAKIPPKSLWAFCWHYSRGCRRYLLLLGALSALVAMLEVSLFGFLGSLVDILNENTPETIWQSAGLSLAFMGFVVVAGLPIMVSVRSLVLFQTLQGNYPMSIRWLAHRHLLGQSMSFFQDEFAGRIATKVMQTALAVRESMMKLVDVFLYIIVYFIGIVVLVASLDFRLAVPFIVWLLTYFALLAYFLPRLASIASKQADARSTMTGRIVDTYTNINTVKLFSHDERETEYARSSMEGFLKTVYPQMRYASALNICLWIINSILTFSVAAMSVWMWSGDLITAGAIAAAMGLILRLYGMSQWVMWEVAGLFENIGTVKDGINTLTTPRSVQDKPNAKPLQLENASIDFNRVIFSYGKDDLVFDDFNLNIAAGEKIGLVGRSGAGKSTLVNLLLRFYDVQKGSVEVDQQNVTDIQQESLREKIGMVTQDTSLLHRSIRENLLYGRPDATEEEMIQAAKFAKAHDFIQELSDDQGNTGYDVKVGERGVKLSGGQRQRIAIARVLLKNAPILILDEATSALDSEVEAAIQENLTGLMEGKTVIAIAHRLSTIAAMDRLVVVEQGRIIEQGSHQQLVESGGVYAQLWARQSGGFLGE